MNKEMVDATLTRILNNPQEHAQRVWICGTSACAAGHALLAWREANGLPAVLTDNIYPMLVGTPFSCYSEAAEQILGITEEEGDALFYTMDADKVVRALKIMSDEGVVPMDYLTDYE